MFNCKRCCRNCFPNGCCGFCKPPPRVQQQFDTTIDLKKAIVEKETPYGYIYIYPGVRTSQNNYTCPMLSVHLYRYSQFKADMTQDKRTIIVDKKNEQQTHQGPQQLKTENRSTAEEEIIMVPVEDVIRITSKSEMKKGIQSDTKSHVTPVYGESENCYDRCYASVRNCCSFCCQKETKVAPMVVTTTTVFSGLDPNRSTNFVEEHLPVPKEKEDCCTCCSNFFRCWCCRKKKLVDLIKRTNIVAERQAQRVITITIEYSKYSNLDTPSNARLLSGEQQVAYYKEKFQPDTELKFYLVNNTEYDSNNFELKRQQAEILCRTVMQLKGMRNHYPSENEFEQILDQPHRRIFGDLYSEPNLQLSFDPTTTRRKDFQTQELPQSPHQLAIQGQRTTTSEYDEKEKKKVAEEDIDTHENDF